MAGSSRTRCEGPTTLFMTRQDLEQQGPRHIARKSPGNLQGTSEFPSAMGTRAQGEELSRSAKNEFAVPRHFGRDHPQPARVGTCAEDQPLAEYAGEPLVSGVQLVPEQDAEHDQRCSDHDSLALDGDSLLALDEWQTCLSPMSESSIEHMEVGEDSSLAQLHAGRCRLPACVGGQRDALLAHAGQDRTSSLSELSQWKVRGTWDVGFQELSWWAHVQHQSVRVK